MKTPSHPRLVTMLWVSSLLLLSPRAFAQEETAWTTKESTTFWAQLGGWDGRQVILTMRGRDFRVPVSRLSPKSLEKASEMLDLPHARMLAAAAESELQPTPSATRSTVAKAPVSREKPTISGPVPFREYYASVMPQRGDSPAAVALADAQLPTAKLPETESAAGSGLGKRIHDFCVGQIGRKVGDGQCATLATQALSAAGARGRQADFPGNGDYVWGKEVALIEVGRKGVKGSESLADVKPGDIIQFRDARFEGVSRNGGGTYWMAADHHTAVVASADRTAIVVYHQNWGTKIVRKDIFYPADLKRGWLRIYRPVAQR